MYTPRINWVLFVLFSLTSIGVLTGALLSPSFREISYAPLRELIIPPLLQVLQTEQTELRQFDAELEKTSLI